MPSQSGGSVRSLLSIDETLLVPPRSPLDASAGIVWKSSLRCSFTLCAVIVQCADSSMRRSQKRLNVPGTPGEPHTPKPAAPLVPAAQPTDECQCISAGEARHAANAKQAIPGRQRRRVATGVPERAARRVRHSRWVVRLCSPPSPLGHRPRRLCCCGWAPMPPSRWHELRPTAFCLTALQGHNATAGFENLLVASFCDMLERMCRHGSRLARVGTAAPALCAQRLRNRRTSGGSSKFRRCATRRSPFGSRNQQAPSEVVTGAGLHPGRARHAGPVHERGPRSRVHPAGH